MQQNLRSSMQIYQTASFSIPHPSPTRFVSGGSAFRFIMADNKQPVEKVRLSFAEDFMLSGVAAVTSKTIAAPIERIKMVVQNQDEMIRQGTLEKPFKGIMDCFAWINRNEGIMAFWRSNFTNCLRYFPTQALNFAFKGQIKRIDAVSNANSKFFSLIMVLLNLTCLFIPVQGRPQGRFVCPAIDQEHHWWWSRWRRFSSLRLSFGLCSYPFGQRHEVYQEGRRRTPVQWSH